MNARDRWVVGSLLGLIGFIVVAFLVAILRGDSALPEVSHSNNRPFAGENAYQRATETQGELIDQMIAALSAVADANDRPKIAELTDRLAHDSSQDFDVA